MGAGERGRMADVDYPLKDRKAGTQENVVVGAGRERKGSEESSSAKSDSGSITLPQRLFARALRVLWRCGGRLRQGVVRRGGFPPLKIGGPSVSQALKADSRRLATCPFA